jgi:GABA permease
VIAAAISPDGVFLFLLNSSGAIILFVYLLIALSQIVLRRRAKEDELKVKMWLYPGLSILTTAGIAAVLVQMAITGSTQISLGLSCLSWAVVLVLYIVVRQRGGSLAVHAPVINAEASSECALTEVASPQAAVTGK